MISQQCSSFMEEQKKCYTIVSTFEKKNSLCFKLLFGNYKKISTSNHSNAWQNATDYFFEPGQIFGYSCESKGKDFRKFYYAFIVQACYEYEIGHIIPGVSPGAKILIKTLNKITTERLLESLKNITNTSIDLTKMPLERFIYLNELLYEKINVNYFVSELINHEKDY